MKLNFSALFRPALLRCIDGYNGKSFKADLGAGLTVAVVAIPLAMAFAIASGATPQAGLFTAIIAGFIVSALGGSRYQIAGPTGAYIVIVAGIVAEFGFANLMICTIASGFLLLLMGMMRLGALIRFIPTAIVIGFTNGIAVLILLSQVRDYFGLPTALPEEFFARIGVIVESLPQLNWQAVALSTISVVTIMFWPTPKLVTVGRALSAQEEKKSLRLTDNTLDWTLDVSKFLFNKAWTNTARLWHLMLRVPAPLAVLVLASLTVAALTPFGLNVETIGSRFAATNGIPQGLPAFQLPEFSWNGLRHLASPIITIALLGAIESLLSARVADAQSDDRHDPNQELMAQGIANIVAPFFGGIPSTGAIARTATNIRAGAFSPISGMIHSLALLIIVLIAAPLASYIPLSALCAILVVVAYNMGDWRAFVRMQRYPLNYRLILVTTFVLTIMFSLTLAVEVGLILSSLFFIFRVSNLTRMKRITSDDMPTDVVAFELSGSLFFGSVGKIEPLMNPRFANLRVVIFDLHLLLDIDDTGLDALTTLQKTLVKRGGTLVLCNLTPTVRQAMIRTGFIGGTLPRRYVVSSIKRAVVRALRPITAAPTPEEIVPPKTPTTEPTSETPEQKP